MEGASQIRRRAAERTLRQKPTRELSREMPIVINNRNRLTYLRALIDRLHGYGLTNVIVLDNDSTYPPLLEYYRQTAVTVVPAGGNLGPYALWRYPRLSWVRRAYFAYTDSDVVPDAACPSDFMELFLDTLRNTPRVAKVGFSLRIDDLPSTFDASDSVIAWERRFWEERTPCGFFRAPIDTTFAVYRPFGFPLSTQDALRSPPPYLARHLPWYVNSTNLDEEECYYRKNVAPGASWWSSGHGARLASDLLRLEGRA